MNLTKQKSANKPTRMPAQIQRKYTISGFGLRKEPIRPNKLSVPTSMRARIVQRPSSAVTGSRQNMAYYLHALLLASLHRPHGLHIWSTSDGPPVSWRPRAAAVSQTRWNTRCGGDDRSEQCAAPQPARANKPQGEREP